MRRDFLSAGISLLNFYVGLVSTFLVVLIMGNDIRLVVAFLPSFLHGNGYKASSQSTVTDDSDSVSTTDDLSLDRTGNSGS